MSYGARRLLHILSITLITAGIVVMLDVGLTLVWEEPLSAAYGSLKQSQASDELDQLESEFPARGDLAALQGVVGDAQQARVLADRYRAHIKTGEGIGRIIIDRINLNMVVIQGTDTASLQKGPGHYPITPLPGEPGTVAIAGHRTTYLAPFRHINDIQNGDEIRLQMPYAAFTYVVEKHEIVDPTDTQIVDPVGYDRLLLTACHPLYSAAKRWALFARLRRIDTFAPSGGGVWPTP